MVYKTKNKKKTDKIDQVVSEIRRYQKNLDFSFIKSEKRRLN